MYMYKYHCSFTIFRLRYKYNAAFLPMTILVILVSNMYFYETLFTQYFFFCIMCYTKKKISWGKLLHLERR